MGVANERSIATSIAKELTHQGAQIAYSFLPDDTGKMEKRVQRAVEELNPAMILPCNVNQDEDIACFFGSVQKQWGNIDFLVHSIAFAPIEDIRCDTIHVTRSGFLSAMESSCYSFIATSRAAAEMMNSGGSILTLSYFGSEKVVAGYNLMGVAKAALESSVRYLAYDLGPKNIRLNGLSAGVLKTLAASAVGDFGDMLSLNESIAPLNRNVSGEEVANMASFILSGKASGITGEVIHVDCGYNIMGSPGRALAKWNLKPRDFR